MTCTHTAGISIGRDTASGGLEGKAIADVRADKRKGAVDQDMLRLQALIDTIPRFTLPLAVSEAIHDLLYTRMRGFTTFKAQVGVLGCACCRMGVEMHQPCALQGTLLCHALQGTHAGFVDLWV